MKTKTKTIYALRVRNSDSDEWSNPQWYKTKKQRDKVGSLNRIVGGIRTHSYQERKTLDEIEEIFTY